MQVDEVGAHVYRNAVLDPDETTREYYTKAIKELLDNEVALTVLLIDAKVQEYRDNVIAGDPPYPDPVPASTPIASGPKQ